MVRGVAVAAKTAVVLTGWLVVIDIVGVIVCTLFDIAPLRAVVNSAGIGWAQRTIGRDGLVESAHSLEAFTKVVQINLIGTFNVMEAARVLKVGHLLMASTSSVYGANEEMPFRETDRADHPLTIYAATKKANEAMGHAYAHLHDLPVTMFRFFTVYGPWGRPDMAPFKFTKAILAGEPIDIYNNGERWRDFTYVTDLVQGIL
eukprot:gene12568-15354_t